MKIAIIGYGEQGRSAYDYWRQGDNQITVCDENEKLELPSDANRQLGEDYLANLDQFDLIVRSPIIHPGDLVAANAPSILKKVTSNTNEFFRVCPSRHIIAVTGTKGKGTTSTLIAKMLEATGQRVHLGGNIGTPPLDLLKEDIEAGDFVVLELANFQLIDLHYSPHIAICLMVVPEHLNWHVDMEEYVAAKRQLFVHQTADDQAIYFAENSNSKRVADGGLGQKIPYYAQSGALVEDHQVKIDGQTICRTDELKLLGQHNWQNVCAAVTAVWQVTQDIAAIRSVLTSFSGLEHRLELIRELDGIKYYDDSFGTTPETAIVAIEAFEQPVVVILGGSEKGATYEQLAQTVKDHRVRAVVAIGLTGPKISQSLRAAGYNSIVEGGKTMAEVLATARAQAHPGDVVLLSTACASFDMFNNYKDRGEQFKQAVLTLV